jgi:hypothetical protein
MGAFAQGAVVEKKRNPNFIYWYSEALKQEIAMSKKTGDVTCADGVKYSKAEVGIMEHGGTEVCLAGHRIKKIFGGEIIGFERRSGTVSQGKPDTSTGTENSGNTKNPGMEMANPSKNGAGNESGELDIF